MMRRVFVSGVHDDPGDVCRAVRETPVLGGDLHRFLVEHGFSVHLGGPVRVGVYIVIGRVLRLDESSSLDSRCAAGRSSSCPASTEGVRKRSVAMAAQPA